MKLYTSTNSTPGRAVLLFCAEQRIPHETVILDLRKGEHREPPYLALNPNALVPTLVDDDLILTEGAAILRYLADKHASPAYPTELRARARVNERLDWFNTQLQRDWTYHFLAPQLFPHQKRAPEEANRATIEWGKTHAHRWMKVLDEHLLGARPYVAGDAITIADYFGAAAIALGDVVRADLSAYPNVTRWMTTMRALPSWQKVHHGLPGFAAALAGTPLLAF